MIEHPGAGAPSDAPGLDEQTPGAGRPATRAGSNLTQHFPKKKQHPGGKTRAGLILLVS